MVQGVFKKGKKRVAKIWKLIRELYIFFLKGELFNQRFPYL